MYDKSVLRDIKFSFVCSVKKENQKPLTRPVVLLNNLFSPDTRLETSKIKQIAYKLKEHVNQEGHR